MKKIILFSLSIFLFLFGISSVKASTLLNVTEVNNGNINTSLNFEEGYVGGIDITLKVSGNVSLSSINWDTSILSNYTKKYSYDEVNHTIRIIVTTGNQTRNLANKDGLVSIGTLVFNGNDKSNYTIDITSLTYIDANYTSIVKSDLAVGGTNSFVYDTNKKPVTPSEPENPSNPSTDNPSNNTNNSGNNSNASKPNTGNQNTGSNEADGDNENNDSVEGNENESNVKEDDEKKPTNNNNSSKPKEEEKEEKSTVKKESSLMAFFKIAVLVLLGLSIIGILIKIVKK